MADGSLSKTVPVTPAIVGEGPAGRADGVPYSPLYDDVYHAQAGAWAQARHVFLAGNGLPQRWQRRRRFVILETGFGLGNNFLATWAAWQRDAERCDHLYFISIEKHPLHRADLERVHGLIGHASDQTPMPSQAGACEQDEMDRSRLAERLLGAWPALTPGLHSLHFDEPRLEASNAGRRQRVTLLLGLGDIADLLPAIMAQVDAFYLDGFAPAKNPQMWDEGLLSRLNRLAAPGCTAATWSAARTVRDGLAQAGFQVTRAPGFAGKRDMVRAVYEPRFTPSALPGGLWPEPIEDHRHAIVVGAGLAGCAAALALCKEGWRVTLIDRQGGPAAEASGNPGGLFHSVLHADDGIHARAHRAAAMATWRIAKQWIEAGKLNGQADGLLRLDGRMASDQAHEMLQRQGLPPDHVQWLDKDAATARAGLSLPHGGWLFHQGGWLHPAGLAHLMLDEASQYQAASGEPLLRCLWHQPLSALKQSEAGDWQVLEGQTLVAQAATLVLCSANETQKLLATLAPACAAPPLPLSPVRGQITVVTQADVPQMAMPALPVAGGGYGLALSPDALLCGATTQHGDHDASVREADHRHNLRHASRLGMVPELAADGPLAARLTGRTSWRATTPDRLPLIGAVPWSEARLQGKDGPRRLDQVRLIPRQRNAHGGLYVLTGLGSRGITWSCLAADLLVHWVAGTPCPVELDLRDAMDPARFLVRQRVRESSKVAARP